MKKHALWRLLSIAAVALYVLLTIVMAVLLLSNIGLAIMFCTSSLLLACCIWFVFIYRGTGKAHKRYIWLSLLFGSLVTIQLVYFMFDQKNRRLVLFTLVITVLYVACIKALRRKYWQSLRYKGEKSNKTANFKNPYLIINPVSGHGRALKAKIDIRAKEQGITVLLTKKGEDISKSALTAVKAGADVIGISGGDGSIGSIAKVAIDHNLPIIVLPGGTRCHFARDIGLDPVRIVDSLASYKGVERKIDVGLINDRVFVNNASFGLYADIISDPDYRHNKMRVSRRVMQSLFTGKKESYSLIVKHKNISFSKAVQILVGVNQYNTISLFELGHRNKQDQGIIQVTAITTLSKKLINNLLTVVRIKKLLRDGGGSGIYQWDSKSVVIRSTHKQLKVGVDGEFETYKTPVTIKVLPKKLRIYVPAEGVRNRQINPLSPTMIKKVWQSIWS
jgi:diacylglycerol kinase family enzyme